MESTKVIEITVKQLFIALIIIVAVLTTVVTITNINTVEVAKEQTELIKEEVIKEQQSEIIAQRTTEDVQVMTRSALTERQKKQQEQVIEEVVPQYKTIEEITISRDMDLTIRTGLSKEDFKLLISNVKYDTSKFFYENSDIIYDLCEEYQLNEIFFCGLISAESGWNIASNHRNTHNYISLMSNGKLIRYNSVEEGLRVAAQKLHDNYLTEGGKFYYGKTLSGVKTKFCPASSTWVNLVYGRMEQIMIFR